MMNECLFSFPSRENGNGTEVAFVTDTDGYTPYDILGTNKNVSNELSDLYGECLPCLS